MKISLVKVSSGFSNVADKVIHASAYYGSDSASRPGSGYDSEFSVELPTGYSVASTEFGDMIVSDDGYSEDAIGMDDGMVWVNLTNSKLSGRTIWLKPIR